MTKESLAALLNGREYREEFNTLEAKQAKEAGLVIVYGASDDLMEFDGAISDEMQAGNDQDDIIVYFCDGKYCLAKEDEIDMMGGEGKAGRRRAAAEAALELGNVVSARWAPKDVNASFHMTTKLPHASFDIFEEGELYCRAMVFALADLK